MVDFVGKEMYAVASNHCQSRENKNLHGPSNRISLKLTFIVCFLSLFTYRIVAFLLATCSTPIFQPAFFSLLTNHVHHTRPQEEKQHGKQVHCQTCQTYRQP